MERESIRSIQNLSSEKREQLRARLIARGMDLQALPVLKRPPDLGVIPTSFASNGCGSWTSFNPATPRTTFRPRCASPDHSMPTCSRAH
jgi:hypothetical protein